MFAIDAIAAPFTPIFGILIKIKFKISFTINPTSEDTAGITTLPNPCNAPLAVWTNTENNIVIALSCNNKLPEAAFGNSNANICSENIIIPTVHGNPINIVTSIEKDIRLLAVFLSFFAIDADTAGTNAVAKATLKDKGNVINVSTFPLKMPYCTFALAASINVFNPLTTVMASIFLLIADIIELKELSYKMVKRIYEKHNINHIEIYKSCHHGGGGTNTPKLCNLLKAKYVVITNTSKWLDSYDTFDNLKTANCDVEILKTDYYKYIFEISDNISYEKIKEDSLFITLGKK